MLEQTRCETVTPPQGVVLPGSRLLVNRNDFMAKRPTLTTDSGMPVSANHNSITAGPPGPGPIQDFTLFEKLAHPDRHRLPERGQHPNGSGPDRPLPRTPGLPK